MFFLLGHEGVRGLNNSTFIISISRSYREPNLIDLLRAYKNFHLAILVYMWLKEMTILLAKQIT